MINLKLNPFLRLLKPYTRQISLIFLSIFIANLAGLVFPWIIKIVIDGVIVKKDLRLLNIAVAGLVASFVVKAFFGFLREYLASVTGESIVRDLRNKIYWHLHKLSVKYVDNTPSGKIISGLTGDVESIKEFISGGAVDFIYSSFSIIFVTVVLFALDRRLALLSLFYLPVFAAAFLKFSPRLKEKHALVRQKHAELASRISEVLNGIRIVAGFAGEKKEADIFSGKQKEIFEATVTSHKLSTFLWMSAEFLSSLGLALIVWFGARQVIAGTVSIGTLMAFYTYTGLLFYPVIRIAVINNYYQEASASMDRIKAVLSIEPEIKEVLHPVFLPEIKGNVVFSGVSFSYDNRKPALQDIDLNVKYSETVAIAGKSGSGKTTLINLLLRFYDPTEGNIYVDGHDLRDLPLAQYRSKMAMVIQDDYLFGSSVKENISYAKPGAGEDEIVKAATMANAHQFIIQLPDGYDTLIGERGVRLSYGQRQRISIARAMLRDPAILILDEATSGVDSETERLIIEDAFKKLMRGRTTFIISHRLATLGYADRIIFLEDGRITETGSHAELLEKNGSYRKMWLSGK